MKQEPVVILLATYNGEAFIRTMIDSVLAQEHASIRLILSDDGSSDATPQILEEYAALHPDRITHYRSGRRFGCARSHFLHLLSAFGDAPYVMFCDQDDFWHADKVRKTLARMQSLETDPTHPVLVHTDLRVVDRELNQIAPSFCRRSALDGTRTQMNRLLVNNVVTGCTVMINRALSRLCGTSLPEDRILMHDWWLALLASACGTVGFLDEATIDYRQHGNNSVGAKNVYSPSYLFSRLRSRRMRKSLEDCADQAAAFADFYGEVLPEDVKEICLALASTKGKGVLARDRVYAKYKLHKNGFVRCFAQYLGW